MQFVCVCGGGEVCSASSFSFVFDVFNPCQNLLARGQLCKFNPKINKYISGFYSYCIQLLGKAAISVAFVLSFLSERFTSLTDPEHPEWGFGKRSFMLAAEGGSLHTTASPTEYESGCFGAFQILAEFPQHAN